MFSQRRSKKSISFIFVLLHTYINFETILRKFYPVNEKTSNYSSFEMLIRIKMSPKANEWERTIGNLIRIPVR